METLNVQHNFFKKKSRYASQSPGYIWVKRSLKCEKKKVGGITLITNFQFFIALNYENTHFA